MLGRLSALWAQLTAAAATQDQPSLDRINREIAECRQRVEEIRRTGTAGSA